VSVAGKTVLITGATGFIGGRLVEKLFLEHQVGKVRVLVRGYQKVPRIACFPVEMLSGALDDEAFVRQAVQGVDVVFHLAHDAGTDKVVRTGVRHLAQAAAAARARVVNLSTAAVYGAPLYNPKGGVLEEDTALGAIEHDVASAEAKREAEAIFRGVRELEVVHLQPALVYGPYGKRWVEGPLAQLHSGQVAMVDDGRAPCAMVYVDDVVEALVRAAWVRGAVGESFLLTAPRQHSWRDYLQALEGVIERQSGPRPSRLVVLDGADLKAQQSRETKAAARALYAAVTDQSIIVKAERIRAVERSLELARRRLPGVWGRLTSLRKAGAPPPIVGRRAPELPVHLPDATTVALQRSRASVAAYKAMRVLGYEPRFDLELGMAQVESYARWARLV
jgi:nucleoside-diphosphate-sugar epimerase